VKHDRLHAFFSRSIRTHYSLLQRQRAALMSENSASPYFTAIA
jgi:hypothetical protein